MRLPLARVGFPCIARTGMPDGVLTSSFLVHGYVSRERARRLQGARGIRRSSNGKGLQSRIRRTDDRQWSWKYVYLITLNSSSLIVN